MFYFLLLIVSSFLTFYNKTIHFNQNGGGFFDTKETSDSTGTGFLSSIGQFFSNFSL